MGCIIPSIKSLREVDHVELYLRKTGRRITLTGLEEPSDVYDLRYSGDLVHAQILITDEIYKGNRSISFRHGLGSYHELLNQSAADQELQIMLKVEEVIAERCGISEVLNSLEYCSGITCNEI
jgi:hypothetical protein